jgi:hypothetical protein
MLDLLARRGQAHEAAHRAMLGKRVVEIPDFPSTLEGLRDAEAATLEAMRGPADVVCQAAFFDGTWRGQTPVRKESGFVLGSPSTRRWEADYPRPRPWEHDPLTNHAFEANWSADDRRPSPAVTRITGQVRSRGR